MSWDLGRAKRKIKDCDWYYGGKVISVWELEPVDRFNYTLAMELLRYHNSIKAFGTSALGGLWDLCTTSDLIYARFSYTLLLQKLGSLKAHKCPTVLQHMKIFNWMQSKLTGKPQIKKPKLKLFDDDYKVHKPPKEDQSISDWPHGLLTIGTLGSNHESIEDLHANPPPSPRDPLRDFTPEEATHIQNELNSFFNEHVDQSSSSAAELGKFLNKQSSIKLIERTSSNAADFDEPKEHFNSRFQRSASVVLNRGKDVHSLENTNTAIGKKSLSFLLKKMFVCSSGFAPKVAAPAVRDPIPESRMEKLLRAILHKKIYPQQSSNSTMYKKKYLNNRHITKSVDTTNEQQLDHKADDSDSDDDGSKWVKTDSEYIVLEIKTS